MNKKTSIFGNADVSRTGGFLLNRVFQFLEKAVNPTFQMGKTIVK